MWILKEKIPAFLNPNQASHSFPEGPRSDSQALNKFNLRKITLIRSSYFGKKFGSQTYLIHNLNPF